MKKKFLIIDDDKFFVDALKYSFSEKEYIIDTANSGKNILEKIKKEKYDFILMELIIPGVNGLELCESIRQSSKVPIIIITKKEEDINKILALEYGADDYLVKPFNLLELKARIKAILRRVTNKNENNNQNIRLGNIEINSLGRKVNISDREIDLTGKEFDLFYVLISNPGKTFKRKELLELVWGYEYYGDFRTIDVHIRRIREKIEENPSNPEHILTKWGVGYYYRSG